MMRTVPTSTDAPTDRVRGSRWTRSALGNAGTGALGAVLISLASPGAGSLRTRDEFLEALNLSGMRQGIGQGLSMVVLYVGVLVMLLAWVRVGREVLGGRVTVRRLTATVAAWTAPLLVAAPIYSRDVYSYLAQGALLRDGFDPYSVGPIANPGPLLDNVGEVWTSTPAPYGPVFLLLADAVTSVTGDSVVWGTLLLRLAMLPGLALLVWALPRLATLLGSDAGTALWLGALNPLVLVHLVGGVHNEMLMVGLMAAGLVLVARRHHLSGFAVIALAVGIKASAGLALPFAVWIWVAHRRAESSPTGAHPALAPVLLRVAASGAAVFAVVFGLASALAGLGLGWVGALSGSSEIVNWLSAPTAAAQLVGASTSWLTGVGVDTLLPVFRVVSAVILVVLLAVVWWSSRHGPVEAVRGLAAALVAVVILSPAVLPWYYSWPLALLAPLRWSPRALAVLAGVSTWLMLIFRPPGNMGLYSAQDLVAATAAAVLVGVSLLRVDPLRLSRRTRARAPGAGA